MTVGSINSQYVLVLVTGPTALSIPTTLLPGWLVKHKNGIFTNG